MKKASEKEQVVIRMSFAVKSSLTQSSPTNNVGAGYYSQISPAFSLTTLAQYMSVNQLYHSSSERLVQQYHSGQLQGAALHYK